MFIGLHMHRRFYVRQARLLLLVVRRQTKLLARYLVDVIVELGRWHPVSRLHRLDPADHRLVGVLSGRSQHRQHVAAVQSPAAVERRRIDAVRRWWRYQVNSGRRIRRRLTGPEVEHRRRLGWLDGGWLDEDRLSAEPRRGGHLVLIYKM